MTVVFDKPTKGKIIKDYTLKDVQDEFKEIHKVLTVQSKLDVLQAKLNLKQKEDMQKLVNYTTLLFAIVSAVLVLSVICLSIAIYIK